MNTENTHFFSANILRTKIVSSRLYPHAPNIFKGLMKVVNRYEYFIHSVNTS